MVYNLINMFFDLIGITLLSIPWIILKPFEAIYSFVDRCRCRKTKALPLLLVVAYIAMAFIGGAYINGGYSFRPNILIAPFSPAVFTNPTVLLLVVFAIIVTICFMILTYIITTPITYVFDLIDNQLELLLYAYRVQKKLLRMGGGNYHKCMRRAMDAYKKCSSYKSLG